MCGGIGSRFWPFSRTDLPKQFLDFFGTGRSLLQMSYDRILSLVRKENIFVVTNARYAAKVKEQLPDITDSQILAEPARRNTAPCIAWAAAHIAAIDPDATMIVTPSDHLITGEAKFVECLAKACDFAETHDALLTLGIKPTRPETGYGYIQIGRQVSPDINEVKTFTEKPDHDMARIFLDTGEFFWNSGIFVWRTSSILEAMKQCAPDLYRIFAEGRDVMGTPGEKNFIETRFPSCPAISIDYAVMEKASNVYIECVDFGWNDLGTWGALYDISPKNRERNVTQGCKVFAYDTTGSIVASRNPDKLIVACGLKDYIVADADDVLLICPREREQQIKQIVDDVRLAYGDKHL